MVTTSCSRSLLAAALLLVVASARTQSQLTLATVLERGPTLVAPLPRAVFVPGGAPTIVLTDAAGNESLHRIVDGKVDATPIVTAEALARLLPDATPGRTLPPLSWADGETLRIEHGHAILHWRPGGETAVAQLTWPSASVPAADAPFQGPMHAVAPGDRHVVYRHEHQVFVADRQGQRRQLTFDGGPDIVYGAFDGGPDIVYGGAAHRAEFGIDRGLFWSSDGRFAAFYREDLRVMPPAPRHGRYPMAGGAHGKVTVAVCDTTDFHVAVLEHDPDEDVYWTNVTFGPEHTVWVTRVTRGQDHLELVRYDARSGKRLGTLLTEHDAEWVEPEHPPVFLPDGRFLWWSSRSGFRHLWLCNADGTVVGPVTQGNFDVQELLATAPAGDAIVFAASGEDPRQRHVFTAAIDRQEIQQLTRERGTHEATVAADGQWAHVVWSNLTTRPNARLVHFGSAAVVALPQPADPLAGMALPKQRLFQIPVDDDTVLYGHVALPPDHKPGQRCPVLLYVYGGPHVQLVTDRWLGGAPLWLQALAAEGYVVCRLDNRGTPNRGITFEQAVHRRLGVLEVEDQMRAVAWLQKQPFVDADRIGVHGWSFGGFLTLRLLGLHPTTFACGISGAPVTEWAMYETGYTERYMDNPSENPDGYRQSSCLPLAAKLERPLLLVHGTDDLTVVGSHSLAFVEQAILADRSLDYLPYPMQQHGLTGQHKKHFLRTLRDWFARHLRPEHRRVDAPPPEPAPAGDGAGRQRD
jgi:dipeptidyl-peptidase 4